VLERDAVRKSVLSSLAKALARTWGAKYPRTVRYSIEGDKSSPVFFETTRGPNLPNIQATLDLNGGLGIHAVGYNGAECLPDMDAVARFLENSGELRLVEHNTQARPTPHRSDSGGRGGLFVDDETETIVEYKKARAQ